MLQTMAHRDSAAVDKQGASHLAETMAAVDIVSNYAAPSMEYEMCEDVDSEPVEQEFTGSPHSPGTAAFSPRSAHHDESTQADVSNPLVHNNSTAFQFDGLFLAFFIELDHWLNDWV